MPTLPYQLPCLSCGEWHTHVAVKHSCAGPEFGFIKGSFPVEPLPPGKVVLTPPHTRQALTVEDEQ